MWKVNFNNIENGVVNVTATYDDATDNSPATMSFSWSSIIKIGDEESFVKTAKSELEKYQQMHKDDSALKSDLEKLLNN